MLLLGLYIFQFYKLYIYLSTESFETSMCDDLRQVENI